MNIYLDNLASTPIDPRVASFQNDRCLALCANPNSVDHQSGRQAKASIETAGTDIAKFLGNADLPVSFVPSASSALWLALQDVLNRANGQTVTALASAIEHPSLLHHLTQAERQGLIRLTLFPVDADGQPDISVLARKAKDGASLICMMAANNELGIVHPIRDVLDIAEDCGARTIVDASQIGGRQRLSHVAGRADYLVISGSKLYGPRRVGVLAGSLHFRTTETAEAVFGTPDAAAFSAMAYACKLRDDEMDADEAAIKHRRDKLEAILTANIPDLVVNGDRSARLAGALHVSNPNVSGDIIVSRLFGMVALSTGAACQSGVPGPSHVLTAVGMAEPLADGAIRLCVGKFNTDEEIELAAAMIVNAMQESATVQVRNTA